MPDTYYCSRIDANFRIRGDNHNIECQTRDGTWVLHPLTVAANYFEQWAKDFDVPIQVDYETSFRAAFGSSYMRQTNNRYSGEYYDVENWMLSRLNMIFIFKFDNMRITNEFGSSVHLGEIYAVAKCGHRSSNLYGFRTTIQYSHFIANYHHSHTSSSAYGQYTWSNKQFCTGGYNAVARCRDKISTICDNPSQWLHDTIENREYMVEEVKAWCEHLMAMWLPLIGSESISGGPYTLMRYVHYKGTILDRRGTPNTSIANTLATYFAKAVSEYDDVKCRLSNHSIEVIPDAAFLAHLREDMPNMLYGDLGFCYAQITSTAEPSARRKKQIDNSLKNLCTPFRWSGEQLRPRAIENTDNISHEEKIEKATIPTSFVTSANRRFASSIKSVFEKRWFESELLSLTRKTEIKDYKSSIGDYPAIAYPVQREGVVCPTDIPNKREKVLGDCGVGS